MWFLCHFVRAHPATVEAGVPEVACKGHGSSVFSSSVLLPHSTSCLFKHLFYHSATPASQKQPEPIYSKKTETQRQTVRSLRQTLHFLCKCPEEKQDHFRWVQLLNWGSAPAQTFSEGQNKMIRLVYCCFSPSLLSPSKAVFFLEI